MAHHRIKRGLDLPIAGQPGNSIDTPRQPRRVALVADDYVGMRPTMQVTAGDYVRRGQLLFEDKKTPGVRYTAPAAGRVEAIHRGERRRMHSLVIELDQAELSGGDDTVHFDSFSRRHPSELDRQRVSELLIESGLWTCLRTRPYSKVPNPETVPKSIFVTAMDSNPLAAPVEAAMTGREEDFERGLHALAKLTDGPVFVCRGPGGGVPIPAKPQFRGEEFSGPHPAGNPGLHIHFLDPVNRGKLVWYVNFQDVIAIGRLFATGELFVQRVISLAGPGVRNPRLLRTRIGASISDLTAGELEDGNLRVISGSVLSGRRAMGGEYGYLGRYHHQISVLPEGGQRPFLGWLAPGFDRYSIIPTFVSRLIPGKRFRFTTATHGSPRAMVPIGMYERVMPFDLVPSYLLRALHTGNVERAEQLGCLELDEEDVALCTFVDPGKTNWGPVLRQILTMIEKEG